MKFLHGITVNKIAFVNKAANKRKFLLFKSEDSNVNNDNISSKESNMSFAEIFKSKLQAAFDTVFKDEEFVNALSKDAPVDPDSQPAAPLPPVVEPPAPVVDNPTNPPASSSAPVNKADGADGKLIDFLHKQAEAQTKQIEDLRKALDVEREARQAAEKRTAEERQADRVNKIMDSLPHLPVEREDAIELLKTAAGNSEEVFKKAEALLRRMDRVAANSTIFESIGRMSSSSTPTASQKVAELKKADPKLTDEEALLKVYEQNPELYEEEAGPRRRQDQ